MPLAVPCPQCGRFPPPPCSCPPLPPGPAPAAPPAPPEKREKKLRPEVVKLRREVRRGKDVTVIDGLPADVNVDTFARTLKSRCGTGGTVKDRVIELQGDHRDQAEAFLLEHRFRAKRAGG